MSQVYNRANTITILALGLVPCGLQRSVCGVILTLGPLSGGLELFPVFQFLILFFFCQMDLQCEKTPAFSLQSLFNQVLKPLDVKTKFYNAEVSVSLSHTSSGVNQQQSGRSANRRTVWCDMQVLTVL